MELHDATVAPTKRVSAVVPKELFDRMLRQAAKETTDFGERITTSDIVRSALEEYLDLWEDATIVTGSQAPTEEQPKETDDDDQA